MGLMGLLKSHAGDIYIHIQETIADTKEQIRSFFSLFAIFMIISIITNVVMLILMVTLLVMLFTS